jgi:hypothetical protein
MPGLGARRAHTRMAKPKTGVGQVMQTGGLALQSGARDGV